MTSSERIDALVARMDQLAAEFERVRKLLLLAMVTAWTALLFVEIRT